MKLMIDLPKKVYQNAKEDMLSGSEIIVNAIKNGTPIEQEPYEDCTSRENTLKAMIEQLGIRNEDYLLPAEATLYKVVKNMPPVIPQPKTGHWIMVSDRTDWYNATFKCSCCDREIIIPYELKDDIYNDYPYCHCGAKMESEG